MKKFLGILILGFLLSTTSFAGVKKGKGEVKMSEQSVYWFIQYIRGKKQRNPAGFILSSDGRWANYHYCPMMKTCRASMFHVTIKKCEEQTGLECGLFARRYTIIWKNGINPGKGKASTIRKKWSDAEIRAKLTELGFLGSSTSSTSSISTTTPKITKKKKVKGERSVAISWDGYKELIIGTVGYEESDDGKTSMSLELPRNDGSCEGTYLLQNGGKGTWLLACSNNMGAAGTLNWNDDGSVTGSGRDYKDKKVKFTVAKRS